MITNLLTFIKKFKFVLIGALAIGILVFIFLATRQAPINVTETLPKDKSQDIITTSEINVIFNREIKENEQSQISVDILPKETLEFVWLKNQLKIVPKNPLKTETTYALTVNYKGKGIYQFSFETILFTKEQIAKEGLLQSQDDLAFGEAYKKFVSQYPWYLSLPIEKTEYRIVYDFETKSFRIRFKIPVTDKTEEDSLIKKALGDLKKIGVPEPIPYYVIKS